MAAYKARPTWHDEIHEIGLIEPVEAAVANIPHRQLADNIAHIALRIKNLESFEPDVPVLPDTPTNPAGTWTIAKLTAEPKEQGVARQFTVQHSANVQSEYSVTWWQRAGAAGAVTAKKSLPLASTNATGLATISCPLSYSIDVYNQVIVEVSATNTTTKTGAYTVSKPAPPPPPPAVWTITPLSSQPFPKGSTPSFTITNTDHAGKNVTWYIDDVVETMFEGDTVKLINSGSGKLSASGSLTIKSGAIPNSTNSQSFGHSIVVRVVSVTNARRTFTAAK